MAVVAVAAVVAGGVVLDGAPVPRGAEGPGGLRHVHPWPRPQARLRHAQHGPLLLLL